MRLKAGFLFVGCASLLPTCGPFKFSRVDSSDWRPRINVSETCAARLGRPKTGASASGRRHGLYSLQINVEVAMDDKSKPIDPKTLDLILQGITLAGNQLESDEPLLEMPED